MNLLVGFGLLSVVLTVNLTQGDERIHFPQDEPERTFEKPKATVNPVLRNSNCETTKTVKKQIHVYNSDTDSWDYEDIVSPAKTGTPCAEETHVSSFNEGTRKPAPSQARPSRCNPPKQILVYDSDTDSWEEAQWKNC